MQLPLRIARSILEKLKDSARIAPSFLLRHFASFHGKEFEFKMGVGLKCFIRSKLCDADTVRQVFETRNTTFPDSRNGHRFKGNTESIVDAGSKPIIINA